MKYSSSIYQLLNTFRDNTFWNLNHYAHELQAYRSDVSGQWDDSASTTINNQYLHPHAEDEAGMRNLLERKHVVVQHLCNKLDEIEKLNEQVKVLSEEIQKLTLDCAEDLRKSVTNYDFAINKRMEAENRIPQTITLLNTANQGEFSPTY